jgi:glycosyltransferase involved in cell wall biosynthesis
MEKLKKEAEGLPGNLTVKFDLKSGISPLEEKKAILDDKHIYILPTLKEPFGMSLIEASARGNMVVSADTNGPMYMLEAENGKKKDWGIVTGRGVLANITVDPARNLAANIGKAVAWTVDNWDESVRHVLELNRKILTTWTWEGIAGQYIELFREVMGDE